MLQKKIAGLWNMDSSLQTLTGLYRAAPPSESGLSGWFASVDFEALPPEVSYLAAKTAASNAFLGTPTELVPRLRGILKYAQVLNAGMLSGLYALGRQLTGAGIPMLLRKDTAVCAGYPQFPRHRLWKTEISIPQGDFSRAVQLAEEAGFDVRHYPRQSVATRGNTQCIVLYPHSEDAYLWQDALPVSAEGAQFLVPRPEGLMIELAETAFHTLAAGESPEKPALWLLYLHPLTQASFNWTEAAAAAKQHGSANQVRLALECLNYLLPGSVGQENLDRFGTQTRCERLADTALAFRRHSGSKNRLRRLWLSCRIRTADAPGKQAGVFAAELLRAVGRKLSSRN